MNDRCMKCPYCDLEDFYWDGQRLCFAYNCRKLKKPIQQAANLCALVHPQKQAGDAVRHPNHYNWKGEECIYLIRILCRGEEGFDGYCKGNILKYIFREKKKNGLEDLKKARVYLDLLINYRTGKEAAHES